MELSKCYVSKSGKIMRAVGEDSWVIEGVIELMRSWHLGVILELA